MTLLHGLFWLALTVLLYTAARGLHRRIAHPLLSPLIVVPAILIAILLLARVPYAAYNAQSHWLSAMLGPATVAFAIPIFEYRSVIRRHWLPLIVGVVVGMTVAVLSTAWFSHLMGLPDLLARSLAVRSISTPFALAAAPQLGGQAELAAVFVVITGLVGMVLGEWLLSWLPVRSALAKGALFGAGAHAVGTVTAHKRDTEEGVISSLTMIIAGILMVLLAPWLATLL
ncbi:MULTISPECIES: LrgB family protein [unclassified Uliginosibacterium]|jgi:predicted murein hydrolase (TIGR00659 family)|uniref:LrgB family protein n=1 Tax=unclassified Uliginosibacterium TaxID=2621521 RepID=UPI000C7A1FC6|nr:MULTISPECIES: LrgB family protein [unclassified Uliginosibacterium]MDO6387991.1 LrgB family protein [Uliginosibacterium sp. 31-12]PLK48130.1 murein hydrolase effector protein LrgB [Uliginosibacterium sp. TH139]